MCLVVELGVLVEVVVLVGGCDEVIERWRLLDASCRCSCFSTFLSDILACVCGSVLLILFNCSFEY